MRNMNLFGEENKMFGRYCLGYKDGEEIIVTLDMKNLYPAYSNIAHFRLANKERQEAIITAYKGNKLDSCYSNGLELLELLEFTDLVTSREILSNYCFPFNLENLSKDAQITVAEYLEEFKSINELFTESDNVKERIELKARTFIKAQELIDKYNLTKKVIITEGYNSEGKFVIDICYGANFEDSKQLSLATMEEFFSDFK